MHSRILSDFNDFTTILKSMRQMLLLPAGLVVPSALGIERPLKHNHPRMNVHASRWGVIPRINCFARWVYQIKLQRDYVYLWQASSSGIPVGTKAWVNA
jgi:hypothetical protein